jgi:homoserine dehydrogenase
MTTGTTQVRLILVGVGNVGGRLLELLDRKQGTLCEDLGLDVRVTGVSDRSGLAICSSGLDVQEILRLKREGQGVAAYGEWGQPGRTALDLVRTADADLLVEASPANMVDGQPGLGCIETALVRGMHVVTANKAPLVLAYDRLLDLARRHKVQLRFDATVAGGLPAINLGQRDLAAAHIHRLEGVVNLTTNYILTRMAEDGLSYEEALGDAQRAGHAETDPTLDVEGWDAANKLVILARSVLGVPATLDDIAVQGITGIGTDLLSQAMAAGKRVKLVAVAVLEDGGYRFEVKPTWLDANHPLAQLGAKQMGIVFHTDISGSISAAIVEETPLPTASAVLRDLVQIYTLG